MTRFAFCGLVLFSMTAHAQTSGTMQIQLEVLPRVLTVSVSSSQLDFARQRADAGAVILDPATGLANHKAAGAFAMGEVTVHGPAETGFLVSIDHVIPLKQAGGSHEVRFTPSWAQSKGCNQGAFTLSSLREGAAGVLGDDGCATLRFGGTIDLFGAAQGHYTGQLAVRITPL
ncbi:MAG: hypothetical protein OXE92_05350 [Bacteroidetes bacterium]|nr:hypothetical protein [Bacteroidota bacterium]MCY4205135.1 hypothetical protein [Bacteroidota bacterium]